MKGIGLFFKASGFPFLAFFLFVSAGYLSAGPRTESGPGMMHAVESEFDFLVEMIPHLQEAVDTARETAARTSRPELRDFARAIVGDQSREIDMMREWLAAWYPGQSTEAAYRPMMRPTAGLSPDRADRAFLEDMIMHHTMAVAMANQVVSGGLSDRLEVLKLANDIIRTQNEEIERMEEWLPEWYGVETGGHMEH